MWTRTTAKTSAIERIGSRYHVGEREILKARNRQQYGGLLLKVTVKAFGQIMDTLGAERTVDLPDESTVEDLALQLEQSLKPEGDGSKEPRLLRSNLTVLVNGRNIQTLKNRTLREGDYVAFLSPFGGG